MSKQLSRLSRLQTVVLCTAFLASSLTGCDTLRDTGFIVNPSESLATATTAVVASDEVDVVEHILQSLAEAHDFKRDQESSRREAIVEYEKDDGLAELRFWA